MAPSRLLLVLLCTLHQLTASAGAASHADKGAAKPGVQIPIVANYVDNLTETALFHPKGWYAPNICEDRFCVYSNREMGNGRGLTIVSTESHFQKIKRLEKIMKAPESKFLPDPPLFEEREMTAAGSKGETGLVATAPIKRGTKLMSLVPLVMVHKSFMNDTDAAAHARLLDAALRLLPQSTQEKLTSAMAKSKEARSGAGLKEAILAHPFETNAGATHWDGEDHGKHYVVYPELLAVAHDCRPNMAFYIDPDHTTHFQAARKILPGEQLSISYINARWSRAERGAVAHQIWGRPCSCHQCTAGGDLSALAAADARHDEIIAIEEELKNMESTRVTTGMLQHYLELVEQDRLHARLAEPYELVAYNYAYLGYEKRAKKYGNLAIQAGIVEQGPDSNDVIAMRIFTKYPTEHYSWQRKLKSKKTV